MFLAIGVELFARRDLGVTAGLSAAQPARRRVLGVRGPISRAFGEQLPRALVVGHRPRRSSGAMLASLVGPMAAQIAGRREPAEDPPDRSSRASTSASAGGFLQLFVELFYIAAGFAAATFVSKWASDETDGRLEMVLATPLRATRWVDRRRRSRRSRPSAS